MKDHSKLLAGLRANLKKYVIENGLKSLVLGISGGVDSALVAAIVKPVCDELNIPLIGAWIEIDGNKADEKERALLVGKEFCTYFENVNLTKSYDTLITDDVDYNALNNGEISCTIADPSRFVDFTRDESLYDKKVRLGNIKARMRMIYLYNLAQLYKGCTLNTDNQTEYQLGFWTIHGDDFDINLLLNLWKTKVYELADYVVSTLRTKEAKEALQLCIDAVPTDGLGITNSDFEQFGCDSYDEVDGILRTICNAENDVSKSNNPQAFINNVFKELSIQYGEEKVNKIWNRHWKSAFKRKHPIDLTYKQ